MATAQLSPFMSFLSPRQTSKKYINSKIDISAYSYVRNERSSLNDEWTAFVNVLRHFQEILSVGERLIYMLLINTTSEVITCAGRYIMRNEQTTENRNDKRFHVVTRRCAS